MGVLFTRENCRVVMLTTYLHVSPMLRKRGAIPSFPYTSSWRRVYLSTGCVIMTWYLVKNKDILTFTFIVERFGRFERSGDFFINFLSYGIHSGASHASLKGRLKWGLILLLRVGTLRRCDDGLFFERVHEIFKRPS